MLKTEKYHPHKFQPVQELSAADCRMQLCQIMLYWCNHKPRFVRHIFFLAEKRICKAEFRQPTSQSIDKIVFLE